MQIAHIYCKYIKYNVELVLSSQISKMPIDIHMYGKYLCFLCTPDARQLGSTRPNPSICLMCQTSGKNDGA
jgi:hypothetical protein